MVVQVTGLVLNPGSGGISQVGYFVFSRGGFRFKCVFGDLLLYQRRVCNPLTSPSGDNYTVTTFILSFQA